jgi:hypothetical protein
MPEHESRPAEGDGPFLEDVLRYLDGTLSEEGVARMNRELVADAAKREAFVRLCLLDSVAHEELTSSYGLLPTALDFQW